MQIQIAVPATELRKGHVLCAGGVIESTTTKLKATTFKLTTGETYKVPSRGLIGILVTPLKVN